MVRVYLAIMCWPIGPLDLVAAAQGVRQRRAAWDALGHPAEDDQTLRTFVSEMKGANFQMQAGRLKVAEFAPSELAAELTGAEFSHNTRCGLAGASALQGLVPLGCGEQHQCNPLRAITAVSELLISFFLTPHVFLRAWARMYDLLVYMPYPPKRPSHTAWKFKFQTTPETCHTSVSRKTYDNGAFVIF
ncbi:hypothetical protein C8R44DRAFT_735953 [Mycena epipterygia]|nr:hypothetical protein C8R44DRAFT_735953 [Mycena epipterygia]